MKTSSLFVFALCGALFGFGLTWAGMTRPEVVLSFLRFQDFGLVLVLGSAVTTTFLTIQLLPRLLDKPVLEAKFGKHTSIDMKSTLIGAGIFGIGWGISGVCPGPAIAGLGSGNWPMFASLGAMLAGAWVQGFVMSRND